MAKKYLSSKTVNLTGLDHKTRFTCNNRIKTIINKVTSSMSSFYNNISVPPQFVATVVKWVSLGEDMN